MYNLHIVHINPKYDGQNRALLDTLRKKKIKKNGLSFISNRQRRKEGTLRASGVGRDRTHAGPPQ